MLSKEFQDKYHIYSNEMDPAKIWSNYCLYEYVATHQFAVDFTNLATKVKVTSANTAVDPSADVSASALKNPSASGFKESDLKAKRFGSITYEALGKTLQAAQEQAGNDHNQVAINAYTEIATEISTLRLSCENAKRAKSTMPKEFRMLSRSPGKITLAEIINSGEGQGTRTSLTGLLKASLAMIGAKTLPDAAIDNDADMVDVFSSEPTAAHKFVLHLLLWLPETTRSETDVERNIGGALRSFFTDKDWITTSNSDWLFPPAIGMGSTVPRPDYVASINHAMFPVILFGHSFGEAKAKIPASGVATSTPTSTSRLLQVPATSEPEVPTEVPGRTQIAVAALPTLFLLALTSTIVKRHRCDRVDPTRDDYIFAIVYTNAMIEIDALVPIWDGEEWRFSRCTVNTLALDFLQTGTNDWTASSWAKCTHISVILQTVKEHNRRLATRLNHSQFDDVVLDALRVWQDKGKKSKEGVNYVKRLKGENLTRYRELERDLLAGQSGSD